LLAVVAVTVSVLCTRTRYRPFAPASEKVKLAGDPATLSALRAAGF
jgi:hypothetical protein